LIKGENGSSPRLYCWRRLSSPGSMNPETERRLAALIMEEANMMRQRAERDGVSAYLAKPVVKARPNRQFLGAMMRSVQHGNRGFFFSVCLEP
jgi:hypothetical protein